MNEMNQFWLPYKSCPNSILSLPLDLVVKELLETNHNYPSKSWWFGGWFGIRWFRPWLHIAWGYMSGHLEFRTMKPLATITYLLAHGKFLTWGTVVDVESRFFPLEELTILPFIWVKWTAELTQMREQVVYSLSPKLLNQGKEVIKRS